MELLPTDLLEAEVRVEDPGEIAMSLPFKAESLEDLRVVSDVAGAVSTSFLTDPRSEIGAGELDRLDMGEDGRVETEASPLLREK